MTDTLRVLVAAGMLMPLLLLRLSAEEFGAAEYDETREDWTPGLLRRLSWYILGFGLVAVVYVVYPWPRDDLGLVTGRSSEAVLYGIALAVIGTGQAMLFALYRYRDFRFPPARAYPGAAVNGAATAFIDEATFRGILLGFLLTIGFRDWLAIVVGAIIYALATRTGARGRHPYMLLLTLGIGLATGYATVKTGGIGAAVFGHFVTRFALFITTGHAGQVTRRGREPEEVDLVRRPPRGWEAARTPSHKGMPEPRGMAELPARPESSFHRRAEDATDWWSTAELSGRGTARDAEPAPPGTAPATRRKVDAPPARSVSDADTSTSSPRRTQSPRGDDSGGAGAR